MIENLRINFKLIKRWYFFFRGIVWGFKFEFDVNESFVIL